MGKYISITCPECGGKIRKRIGYSVQEFEELEKKGINVLDQYDKGSVTCPGCGTEIIISEYKFNGKGEYFALFD